MKSFIRYFSVFALIMLCPAHLRAEDNAPPTISLAVATNQVTEVPVVSTPESVVVVNAEVPTKVEMPTVPTNQEVIPDTHVSIEPVAPPLEKIPSLGEHSPFSRIKQLAGRWEGSGKNVPGEKQDKIVVTYELTAGGNAVMERIFPGTSQEMITMYYEEKGKLTLLHFCMIGTRSLMTLKLFAPDNEAHKNNVYEFSLLESSGLDPTIDTHMHSLKTTFFDENHMNQEWEMYEAGKPSGSYSFVLSRVPGNQ